MSLPVSSPVSPSGAQPVGVQPVAPGRRPRILLFSTLYPSAARPVHGIFVETRLRELLKSGAAEARVIAPVPWFWSTDARWGEYARMAATPAYEERHGIRIWHPRYPLLPKVGMTTAPLLLALASLPHLKRQIAEGYDFDVIDAHYYYPDGVAAALLARWLGKPFTVTARGTDLNLIPNYRLPRAMIRWTAAQAQGSIGVCRALVDVLADLGAEPGRLHVMRNGVDLERFRPRPQADVRAALGWQGGPLVASVGHLIERKGHHLVIEAMAELRRHHPGARLAIIGDGEERGALQALTRRLGLEDVVRFVGAVPQTQLPDWYSAADMLVLASSREGWANVLLEAMACGTPVVATSVWGTPEVVDRPAAGRLVAERSAGALARAMVDLCADPPDRREVRAHAERFSWDATTQAQLSLFGRIQALRGASA